MFVINLFGEPGSGKSVTSAGLFYNLSINNIKVELVTEVAKGYAWESSVDYAGNPIAHPIFKQQLFLLAEQNRYLERIIGKRDFAIMESPLLLPAIYKSDDYLPSFEQIVLEQFHTYQNINILLERNHSFDQFGRVHSEEETIIIKNKLIDFLNKNNIPFIKFKTNYNIHLEISDYIINNYIN